MLAYHGHMPSSLRRVLLAKPRGYCAGVDRAVQAVEMALDKFGPPVYVRRQIVHNTHVVHDLERFLNTLGTIASTSPLLGLLGTVTGIIKSFNALQAGAAGDPRMLSGGIAEALIATAAGLCVAIPALIAYRYLRGRVESFVVEMEKDAIKLADVVEGAGRENAILERAAPEAPARPVAVTGTGAR